MKRLTTLISFALVAFFATPAASTAAVTHNTTLYGSDYEQITCYDSEYNYAGEFTSYGWAVDVFVQDDAAGYINFTWYSAEGPRVLQYEITANATEWTAVYGGPVSPTAAQLAVITLLYPF